MHVRGQIRERVRVLLSNIDGLQDHVTIDYREVPDESEMPWAWVWVGNEDVIQRTLGAKQQRELDLSIDLIARDTQQLANRVEDIAALIETALAADRKLSGLAQDCSLRAYTVDRNDDGSQPMMRLRLQYIVTYLTDTGLPTVAA
jgi:hypothetical protein